MSGRERVSAATDTDLPSSSGRRLKTWKEIAAFVGCDARTARRWEATRALPVRRYPNGSRSAVYAFESELRAWLLTGSTRTARANLALGELPERAVWPGRAIGWRVSAAVVSLLLLMCSSGLAIWLGGLGMSAPSRQLPPAAAEALYRDGLYSWQTRTPVGLRRAIDDFGRAIRIDSKYAAAYAELAVCYDLIREYTTAPAAVAFARAKTAAERAIALDPSVADAHAALAFADFWWGHNAGLAEREFRTAIALSPTSALAHHWQATFLLTLGDSRRALAEIDTAQRLDPESSAIVADKGLVLAMAGRPAEAIRLLLQVEQTQPLFASPHHYLALIYKERGQDALYLRELAQLAALRKDPSDAALAAAGMKGLAEGGHVGMLKSMLPVQRTLSAEGKAPLYNLARTYAALGNKREALSSLRRSVAKRDTDAPGFPRDPDFIPLRKMPEFRALAATSGLTRLTLSLRD